MNLILGTATFGTKYGIANSNNRLSEIEIFQILHEALRLGIKSLDTAPSYGQAEDIIGKFHKQAGVFEIVSKISDVREFSSTKLITSIEESATKLDITRFSAILFHRSEELAKYPTRVVNDVLESILGTGLVETLGVSVYTEEEIRFVAENFPSITLFQVPENIMDRRLYESELVNKLASQGIRFHIRSVFLQGLLLMNTESLSYEFSEAEHGLHNLRRYSDSRSVSVLDSCLNYVSGIGWASGVVIGVNSKKHLQEVVSYRKFEIELGGLQKSLPENILDPRQWASK
jgi:aryl-alcohol dehydrogenase-like predicted oxidoreductase